MFTDNNRQRLDQQRFSSFGVQYCNKNNFG